MRRPCPRCLHLVALVGQGDGPAVGAAETELAVSTQLATIGRIAVPGR